MSKHPVRNLLIAIAPCLGWALVQPALAADTKTASTFNEAFSAARKAGNETFVWNDKKYIAIKKAPSKDTIKAAVGVTPTVTVAATQAAAPGVAPVAPVAAAPATSAAANSVSSVPPFVFAPVSISPSAPAFVSNTPTPWSPRPNPYIVQPVTVTVAPVSAALPWQDQSTTPTPAISQVTATTSTPFASSQGNLNAKDSGKSRSLLPSFTKVYPTGEKPMVVVTFSCPTELAGINTPSTKILHGIFDLGFGAINATNLLPWTLQQVCS